MEVSEVMGDPKTIGLYMEIFINGGYPQMGGLWKIHLWMLLGYPYFRKPPYVSICLAT